VLGTVVAKAGPPLVKSLWRQTGFGCPGLQAALDIIVMTIMSRANPVEARKQLIETYNQTGSGAAGARPGSSALPGRW
jgi:hypothetical protein